MFANFIYFIIALLIYTTYPASRDLSLGWMEALSLFIGKLFLFALFSRLQFRRVHRPPSATATHDLDHRFHAALSRCSAAAIAVYALDIYGLNLPSLFSDMPFLSHAPTLLALAFLLLFVGYLSIVWSFAGQIHLRLYGRDPEQGSYVWSHIRFSVPVLLPWFLLSGISDVLFALPFETPRAILSTAEGEIVYFIFFLGVLALFGPAMIQKFWRCRPLEPGPFRTRIEALSEKTGLRFADVLYWPIFGGRTITAGVMGIIRRFRYILVTHGLLEALHPEEVDAVIAHEIGHVQKKHLLFYLLFFAGYLLLSYATVDLLLYGILHFQPLYRFVSRMGFHPSNALAALFSLLMIALFLIYFRYIFGFFMRNFERQADVFVYHVMENAQALIGTLKKIAEIGGQPLDKPNWHHFSLQERIDYLEKCEADRSWIRRQDQKIRKSMAVYLAGLILLGYAGYHLNFGATGKRLKAHLVEGILEQELLREPGNPKLHLLLGDIHYAAGRYATAVQVYENALTLLPADSGLLNNLAWLYAACPEQSLRNPERAVLLARQALALESASHIWDTLAESLFVLGDREGAVAAGKEALALALTNRGYYQKQLRKFRGEKQGSDGKGD